MPNCILISAGDLLVSSIPVEEGDLIIACDAGVLYCEALDIKPHILLGDYDSLDSEHYKDIVNSFDLEKAFESFDPIEDNPIKTGKSIKLSLPVEKDDTDTMAAVRLGLAAGYTDFHLYAATGGLLDHTMANIQTLSFIKEQGGMGYMWEADTFITVIKNQAITIKNRLNGRLSVFAIGGKAEGVDITGGLKYTMENGTIEPSFPIGVSNLFTEGECHIGVRDGSLLVIVSLE